MNKYVRAQLAAAAILAGAAAAPAMADDVIPYIEGFGGYAIGAMSQSGDIVSGTGFGGDWGNGGVYGGGVGLKMPIDNSGVAIRVDITGAGIAGLGGNNHTGTLSDGTPVSARVKLTGADYLATVYADIDVGLPVVPFVGFGLGGAHKKIDPLVYTGPSGAFATVDGDKKDGLAWSGVVGASYTVMPHLEFELSYRYTDAGKVSSGSTFTDTTNGVSQQLDSPIVSHLQLHQFVAGIRYLF